VLLRELERLAAEFRDLTELDRTLPSRDNRSMAVLLETRPWLFSMLKVCGGQRPSTAKGAWRRAPRSCQMATTNCYGTVATRTARVALAPKSSTTLSASSPL
jgi:hypothetical protein